jgi:arabinan endo-1,5-alpha-L-arabinosidase
LQTVKCQEDKIRTDDELLRASQPADDETLLRPTRENHETPQEELLRASEEKVSSPLRNFFGTILLLISIAAFVPATSSLGEAHQQEPPATRPPNAVKHVHDPCIIKQGRDYYVFSTGNGIPIRRSRDLVHWEFIGQVFEQNVPAWAKEKIPNSAMVWAPDIAYFAGRYHLYYSISSFGSNRSIIGLATNKTLNPQSKDYQWRDEGAVFESKPSNDYNAIDSNVLAAGKEKLGFVFGSFWTGIKLVVADAKTGKPLPDSPLLSLARRPAPGAVEAPFLVKRDGYYYLFVSFDACCRGVNSTYNIRVGRARRLEGPYVDREGKSLMEGGGTQLLGTQGRYIGMGHCAVLTEGKRHWLVHHFYDGADNGVPTLQVRPLTWDAEGWPVAGNPLEEAAKTLP